MAARLFDIVPSRFFTVLSCPGQEIYAHILFLLYDLFRDNPFGIPREAAVEAAEGYLAETGVWGEWLAEPAGEPAGDDDAASQGFGWSSPEAGGVDTRVRANTVLRRLQETGWLEVETRTNYEEFVTLADYAIQVLDVLDQVRTQRRAEYAGFVYATYAALSIEDVERQGALALGQAYDRTEQLIKELKSLHHNIKRYTERLLKQERPQDILAMHFLEYKDQVLERAYHQLKTSDHVARYRPRILERIERWLRELGWVQQVAREEAGRRGLTAEQAEAEVLRRLQFIRQAYCSMDDLLEEIDRRNAQYAKASLEQIRYHLASGRDTEGRLTELLLFSAARLAETGRRGGEAEELLTEWEDLFALYPVATLEETSLWLPRRRREHRPATLAARPVGAAEREQARQRARRRLTASVTYQRVDAFVQQVLGERESLRATDLGVDTTETFIRLIYVAAFAGSRRVSYAVDFDGEPVVTAGGRFRFKNVTIRRKALGMAEPVRAPQRA